MKLFRVISVGFNVTGQLLIRISVFMRYWRKEWEPNVTVHQVFIHFKKAYDSVIREVLHNILRVWGTTEISQAYQNVIK
jgi:hypothetical protein